MHDLGIVNYSNWYSSARSDGRGGIGGISLGAEHVTQEDLMVLQRRALEESIKLTQFTKKTQMITAAGIGVIAIASLIRAFRG